MYVLKRSKYSSARMTNANSSWFFKQLKQLAEHCLCCADLISFCFLIAVSSWAHNFGSNAKHLSNSSIMLLKFGGF